MKKPLRLVVIITLATLLLMITAGALFLTSSGLQTRLVRLFLPEGASVERVHLGFRGIRLEDGFFSNDQVQIQVRRVRGDFSLLRAVLRRHLRMEELDVSGLRVDLSNWEPPAPAPVPEPEIEPEEFDMPWAAMTEFKGLFPRDLVPPPMVLNALNLDGTLILPGGHRQLVIRVEGGNLRAQAAPALQLTLDYADSSQDAVVSRGSVQQQLLLSFSPRGDLNGLRLETLAEVDIVVEETNTTQVISMLTDLRRTEDASGEEYRFEITLASADPEPLEAVSLHAFYAYDDNVLTGDWTLQADTRTLETLLEPVLHGAWATLRADGSFALHPGAEHGWWRGQGTLKADNLDQLQPELESVPSFLLTTDFDFAVEADRALVRSLTMDLSSPAERSLISVTARQPFGLDLSVGEPFYHHSEEPLAELFITGLPVELINAFLPDIRIDLAAFTGAMALSGTEDGFHFASTRPLTAEGLFLDLNGEPMLANLTLILDAAAGYRSDHFSFDPVTLNLSQEDRLLFQLTAQGSVTSLDTEPRLELDAEWDGRLADLMTQPAAKSVNNLSAGGIRGAANVAGETAHLHGNLDLSLTDLVLADDGRTISDLSLRADTLIETMSHFRLAGPLVLQADEESTDLNLDLRLWLEEELLRLQVKGRGEKVFVNHFQTLADGFRSPDRVEDDPEATVQDVADPSSEPDSEPLWQGIMADAYLEIGELIIDGEYNLNEMVVQAAIEENALRLDQFQAVVGTSAINAKGELLFRPGQPAQPYLLRTDFSFLDFDIGAYLREIRPDADPVLSAVISVSGNARSEAPNLNLLADFLTGDFSVTAEDGVFRALSRGAVSGTIGIAARLGGLAGRLTGQQDVEAVSQLVSYFNAVAFDEFTLQASLKPDSTIELSRLLLRNPDLVIEGHGQVSQREGREWYQQPIELTLAMGARPPLSRLFDELNLLREEPDEDGYRSLTRPVELRGNVGEPDPRPMWEIILEAAARKLLNEDDGRDRQRRDSPLDELRGIFGL